MTDPLNLIIELPIDELHESPTNPRTIFVASKLQELADNLEATGRVLQPLLVRPRTTPLFGDMPDAQLGYEIVFGHRRRRAAELAGFITVPCMVRAMTDTEVKVAQVSENLQREDVHPIEEAQGYQLLLDEGKLTADDLVAQFGKSRTYIYSRLKLLQACPDVRQACLKGEIGSEVALLIARLRSPKLQQKALGYIEAKYIKLSDGGAKSYRGIRDLLNERFALELKDAIFPPDDEHLLPAAGTCAACPKRSGNAPEFTDIVEGNPKGRNGYYEGYLKRTGADVCTDPDCFDSKKKAHLVREAQALTRAGKEVIGGNRARALIGADGAVKGGYIPIKSVPAEFKGLAASSLGVTLQRVVIQDPRTGKTVEAVKHAEVKAAAATLKLPEPELPVARTNGYTMDPATALQREKEQQRNAAKLAKENGQRRALFDQVRAAAMQVPRNAFDARLIALVCMNSVRDSEDRRLIREVYQVEEWQQLVDQVATMTPDALGTLMLDCVLAENVRKSLVYFLDHKPTRLMAAAEHYGVAVSTPSTAARARNGATAAAGAKKSRSLRGACQVARAAGAGDQKQNDEAGCAGDHDGQAQLALDTAAVPEVDQSFDAGFAGVHGGQVATVAEAA